MTTAELSESELYLIEQDMRRSGCLEPYFELVAGGESPRMAAMLASRQCAAIHGGDTTFQRRAHDRMNNMPADVRGRILDIAHKAGINTAGKVYCGGLGKYNDHRAWVSDTSDVLRVAKERHLNVDGVVKFTATPPDPKPKPAGKQLAPDLVAEQSRRYREADPALDEKCRKSKKARRELGDRVVQTHGR